MAGLYYVTSQLADTYGVSVATAHNWIKAARSGKLDLELYERNDKAYIRKSAKNVAVLKRLVEDRKKYRNSRAVTDIKPRSALYEIYSEGQIYDIILNLEKYREVDCEYNYFDGGADNWDQYVRRMVQEDAANSQTLRTKEILELSYSYIDKLLENYDKINLVDIGTGNAMPVRGLVDHLLEQGKKVRYTGLDISQAMMNIAKQNIQEWFGDQVEVEDFVLDIKHERFGHLLAETYFSGERIANLVLFFGGTSKNLRNPDDAFRTIYESLRENDFLLLTTKLDTENSRNFIDFGSGDEDDDLMDPIVRFIFDLLNINNNLYTVEKGYDEELRQRYLRIRFTSAATMTFEFAEGKQVLEFSKGDRILFWRAWHMSPSDVSEQLMRNGFYTLNSLQTTDRQYELTISQAQRSHEQV